MTMNRREFLGAAAASLLLPAVIPANTPQRKARTLGGELETGFAMLRFKNAAGESPFEFMTCPKASLKYSQTLEQRGRFVIAGRTEGVFEGEDAVIGPALMDALSVKKPMDALMIVVRSISLPCDHYRISGLILSDLVPPRKNRYRGTELTVANRVVFSFGKLARLEEQEAA